MLDCTSLAQPVAALKTGRRKVRDLFLGRAFLLSRLEFSGVFSETRVSAARIL